MLPCSQMAEYFSFDQQLIFRRPVCTSVAAEASSTITESVSDTVSRVVEGLRQSLGEGCSSSTSSDSLSVVSANITGIIKQ